VSVVLVPLSGRHESKNKRKTVDRQSTNWWRCRREMRLRWDGTSLVHSADRPSRSQARPAARKGILRRGRGEDLRGNDYGNELMCRVGRDRHGSRPLSN